MVPGRSSKDPGKVGGETCVRGLGKGDKGKKGLITKKTV